MTARNTKIKVGQAGWSIPKSSGEKFPPDGSHLERYARRFPAVEINSSFYRRHMPATYERWRASVPPDFQFAVKIPKTITHANKLRESEQLIREFLSDVVPLQKKQGPLLVQLPPKLAFDEKIAGAFFAELRNHYAGFVACEPRHESWFNPKADALLTKFQVARVAADPDRGLTNGGAPGGWDGLAYFRLHGSPRIYYSDYSEDYLQNLAASLVRHSASTPVWCIFDNTALGAAAGNALRLLELLERS